MEKLPITAIILTKNEEQMVVNCIETVQWCQEILVIDSQSTDSTVALAKRTGAMVYSTDKDSFADRRNYGLSKVRTPWVFYIDPDERVTPELMKEIKNLMSETEVVAITFLRQNIHYGKKMTHGGWQNDQVTRVFRTSHLKGWRGKIHESPELKGAPTTASEPLIHLTHRNMVDGLKKSISWTTYEAELLFQADHPPVTVTTLLRKSFMEFFRRAFLWNGRKDGIEGWIEALVQGMNKFIVYERLWELQQKPSLLQKYQALDQKLIDSWSTVESEKS